MRVRRRNLVEDLVDCIVSTGMEGARPPRDVWETDRGLVIAWDLPGLSAEEVDLTYAGRTVNLRARRDVPKDVVRVYAWRSQKGVLEDELELPEDVDSELADASMKDGRLVVVFPFRGGAVMEGTYKVVVTE